MDGPFRVLLLDDNRASNYIHSKYLRKASGEVEVIDFQSGEDALNYLSQSNNPLPDALFVDINMPTMNAYEFFDRLMDLDRPGLLERRIFLLTTSPSKFDIERSEAYSFLELVLKKPLDLSKINQLQLIS